MTFGVVPSAPETGYGYIRGGTELSSGILELAEFVEKPDADTAAKYLEAGNFYWNSGMFLLGLKVISMPCCNISPKCIGCAVLPWTVLLVILISCAPTPIFF